MGLNDPYTKQFGETDAQFRDRMVRLASAPVVVFQQHEPPPASPTIPPAVREAAVRLEMTARSSAWRYPTVDAMNADILLICQHVLGRGQG